MRSLDGPASLWYGQRQHSRRAAETHRGVFGDLPPLRSDVDNPPVLISEIEIKVSAMFRNSDVDRAFRTIELRPGLQEVECRPNLCYARGLPGDLIVAAPQERSKALAMNGPCFSVAVDHDIGKCGTDRGVKEVIRSGDVDEHIGSEPRLGCKKIARACPMRATCPGARENHWPGLAGLNSRLRLTIWIRAHARSIVS